MVLTLATTQTIPETFTYRVDANSMQFSWQPKCPDGLPHHLCQTSPLSYFWVCRHCGEIRCMPVTWDELCECTDWETSNFNRMGLRPAQFAMMMLICSDPTHLRHYAKLTSQSVDDATLASCDKKYANRLMTTAARLLGYTMTRIQKSHSMRVYKLKGGTSDFHQF